MSNNLDLGVATRIIVMAIVISVILLLVGVGVLVLIHVCIVGRAISRGIESRTNSSVAERGSFGSTNMRRDDIEKLPCYVFKAKENEGSSNSSPVDCAVCLENFKIGDKCRMLPICKHSFHAECVDSWLLKTPICPICRASADAPKGESGQFSELRGSQATGVGS